MVGIDDDGNHRGGARLPPSGALLHKLMGEGEPVPAGFPSLK
jgi:hypothetical protein